MIPISIYKYKKKEKETIIISQEEKEEEQIIEKMEELAEVINRLLSSEGYDYASIFVKEDIDINQIVNIENVSELYKTKIGKVRDANIYLFIGSDRKILEYLEKEYYYLIEIKLNTDKLEQVIEDYKGLFEKEGEKGLKELVEKNRLYLPLLRELDKKLNLIKDLAKEENNPLGLFASSLREIREESISTLEAWINTSSNYVIWKLSQKTNKRIHCLTIILVVFTIIMAFIAFLTLLAKY